MVLRLGTISLIILLSIGNCSTQPDFRHFDEYEPDEEAWRADDQQEQGSDSDEHPHRHPRPGPIQIFIPGPPPPRHPRPQPAPQQQPQPIPQPQPTQTTTPNPLLDDLVAPTDLTPEQRAARRAAYVQFLGELETAKARMPGLDGRWGSQITENLVLLNTQQLQNLNGDVQGPQEADQIFLGDGPLNLRTVQQGQSSAQENELQPVGRFNLDQLGVTPDTQQFRVKRQGEQATGVTCQEFVFDVRQKWPQCAQVISNIRDQSLCGDCWAVSASSTFSDRACIQRAKRGLPIGNDDLFFSAYDTAVCSDAAGDGQDGCNGGSTGLAWRYYANTGVVSGGNNAAQNTSTGPQGGCKPYPFPPMADSDQPLFHALQTECFATCSNNRANENVNNPPKAKALSWNYLYGANNWEQTMKDEIFENGSISVSMMVFNDFKTYSSGVYSHVTGDQLGGHAVRLIGYGNITCSDGSSQKYWLGVNSWNTDWGMNGLFKIARGVDMCTIESRQIAYGIPAV